MDNNFNCKMIFELSNEYDEVKIPYVTLFCFHKLETIPDRNYMFKVNNRNTKTRYEICSKLTIKASERHQWRRCFHCQLWTYFTSWSSVSIVNFEQVNAGWIALSHNGYSINVANCEIFRKIRWLIFCFLTTCFANLEYLLKETRNSSKIRPLNFEKKQ